MPVTPGVAKVQKLSDISLEELPRFSTGFKEFDRVLGGGVVPGSAILIGGNPGAGKSTLLLQTLCKLARADENAVRHRAKSRCNRWRCALIASACRLTI